MSHYSVYTLNLTLNVMVLMLVEHRDPGEHSDLWLQPRQKIVNASETDRQRC